MKIESNNKENNEKKHGFFSKYKAWIIGTTSIFGVAGITLGAASPFLTQTINYYVGPGTVKLKGKNSLFFITDGGDIHDGSFNEAGYKTVTSIAGKYNYESPINSNFSTLIHAYNLAVSRGASVLELNGFLHNEPLKQFSYNNPKIGVIYLDSTLLIGKDKKQQGNVASIVFETEQVGFLAGFAAAAWAYENHTKNHKPGNPLVAGVGGLDIGPVTTYLAGFQQGMEDYNRLLKLPKNKQVQLYDKVVVGKPTYFGGFAPDPQRQVTNYTIQAIARNVDVIFPVGGPQAFTVIRTLQNKNVNPNKMKVIGVDQDLTKQSYAGLPLDGRWTKYVLASATKSIGNAIAGLSSSIFNTTINNIKPGSQTPSKSGGSPLLGNKVFGHIYLGNLSNNWMSLTGEKIGKSTQTIEDLYKSLNIQKYLKTVKTNAEKASSSTKFYGGK